MEYLNQNNNRSYNQFICLTERNIKHVISVNTRIFASFKCFYIEVSDYIVHGVNPLRLGCLKIKKKLF